EPAATVVSSASQQHSKMSVTSGELSEQPSGHPVILLCPSTKSSLFEPRRLTLDDDSLTVKIGRAVAKQRAEPGNAIFDCRVLSRDHGSIYYKDAGFFIVDAGSANGTFVNGRRLSPSTQASKPEPLYSGDLLQLGVEVVDSTKQVTHNSIVARVQLFHPDGTEAVRPPEQPSAPGSVCSTASSEDTSVTDSPASEVANAGATAAIAQCLAESLRRERRLDERLSELNRVFSDLSSTVAGVSLAAPVVCDEAMLSRLERLLDQVQEPEQPGQQQQTQTDGPLAQQLEYYIEQAVRLSNQSISSQRSTLDASDGRQSKADSNPEDFSQDADTSAGVAFTAEGSLHGGSMAEGSVTGLVGEQDKSKPVEQRMLFLPIQCQRQDEHSDSEQPAELLNVFNEVYFQDISSDNEQPTRLYEESDAQKSESGKEQMQLLDSSLLQNYQAQLDEQRQALQEQHENQLKQQLAELQDKHRQEQKALEEDYQQLSRKDKELELQLFEQKERENALLEEQARLKQDLLSLSRQQKLPMQEQQAQDQAVEPLQNQEQLKQQLLRQQQELEEQHQMQLKQQEKAMQEKHQDELREQLQQLRDKYRQELQALEIVTRKQQRKKQEAMQAQQEEQHRQKYQNLQYDYEQLEKQLKKLQERYEEQVELRQKQPQQQLDQQQNNMQGKRRGEQVMLQNQPRGPSRGQTSVHQDEQNHIANEQQLQILTEEHR
ncbi:hypothetical protein BOX15_Mlig018491g1, partial [Macrostomum lignano]